MRDIKRLLEEDIKLQEKLIRRYKQELRNMPAGYLTVRKRKGGCAYFVNTGVSGQRERSADSGISSRARGRRSAAADEAPDAGGCQADGTQCGA